MVDLFGRKQNTTGTTVSAPLTTAELLARLEAYVKPTNKKLSEAQLYIQKGIELDKGLRHIVSQTDLDEDNLIIRKNAMSELLGKEIKVVQAELAAVEKIAEAIKGSIYEELLQQAGTQDEIDTTLFDYTQEMSVADEVKNSTRKKLVTRVKQAGLEYKRLTKELNKSVKRLKALERNLDNNLIASERAHVDTLINMLKAHISELNKIKTDMESNPSMPKVQEAKQDILEMLTRYDARTELAALNEIRAENTEIENSLNSCFKETGEIVDLQKQVLAKTHEIRQIVTELEANTTLIVF